MKVAFVILVKVLVSKYSDKKLDAAVPSLLMSESPDSQILTWYRKVVGFILKLLGLFLPYRVWSMQKVAFTSSSKSQQRIEKNRRGSFRWRVREGLSEEVTFQWASFIYPSKIGWGSTGSPGTSQVLSLAPIKGTDITFKEHQTLFPLYLQCDLYFF